jgi:pyruvate-formate lyase-activating enzyme
MSNNDKLKTFTDTVATDLKAGKKTNYYKQVFKKFLL